MQQAVSIRLVNPVLAVLFAAGTVACCLGGFLNEAPNRVARGSALILWQAPLSVTLAIAAALLCLGAAAFGERPAWRAHAGGIAASLLVTAVLFGAAHFAAMRMAGRPPVTRLSLGVAFWIGLSVGLLALLDAAQRAPAWRLIGPMLLGVLLLGGAFAGAFDDLALAREFAGRRAEFWPQFARHVALVGGALIASLAIGLPLAFAILRQPSLAGPLFGALNILQTIPSIALFGLLVAPLSGLAAAVPFLREAGIGGTGPAPAIIALTLYSLLPLVRNVTAGFAAVPAEAKDAARGLGFDRRRLFRDVELPLALPALFAGLRVVSVQAVGLAAVAALIGAGGLGAFVFQGIGQYALDLVLVGALPIVLLALLVDLAFQALIALSRTPA